MGTARDTLPDDMAALKEALATERAKALDIAAELAVARAKASEDSALIAQQKLRIAKLERQIYGQKIGTLVSPGRSVGADVRRAGGERHRRRTRRRESRRRADDRARIYAHAPRTQYVPRSSSPRARGDRTAVDV